MGQKAKVLQVSDAKETTVEIRILVSAKNSPTAWDLRVYIREKMIEFIQKTIQTVCQNPELKSIIQRML